MGFSRALGTAEALGLGKLKKGVNVAFEFGGKSRAGGGGGFVRIVPRVAR